MKNTNLDIRFNKANNILNQFSDSWEDDKLNLLPNFPKIKDMVSNHITQENYLWLITYVIYLRISSIRLITWD